MVASTSTILRLVFPFILLGGLPFSQQQQQQQEHCSTMFSFNNTPFPFAKCAKLPAQSAVLAWTYNEANSSLAIAFAGRPLSSTGWVAWGINPSAPRMVGTSALIAFSAANGSNVLPYKLTEQVQSLQTPLVCSPVDLTIEATAVEIKEDSFSFFASLRHPSNQTTLHHVWNRGRQVIGFQPQEHDLVGEGLSGFETIDVYTAQALAGSSEPPHRDLKRTHGIINTIAWGIVLPVGAILARYLRPFPVLDPAWFYAHACCQTLGYALGFVGWVLGIRLRMLTSAVQRAHFAIGITLLVLATLQVCSLFARPGKDWKIRKYWNVYHHFLGYAIVLLGIVNIFKGLSLLQDQNILRSGEGWRPVYIASLSLLAAVVLVLETIAWVRYFLSPKPRAGA